MTRPGTWVDPARDGILRLVAQQIPTQRIDPRDHRNLWHVARIQAELDAATELLVQDARTAGKSWAWVGEQLGVSKQAAAKRWGYLDDVEVCEHVDVVAFTFKRDGRIQHGGRCEACGEVVGATPIPD